MNDNINLELHAHKLVVIRNTRYTVETHYSGEEEILHEMEIHRLDNDVKALFAYNAAGMLYRSWIKAPNTQI